MVPPCGRIFSWDRGQVWGSIFDGLNTGLLVVGEHSDQIRRRRAFLTPDFHLLVNMQNLHHLGVKLGIAPLQVVLNFVGVHLVGAENFPDIRMVRSIPFIPEIYSRCRGR